MRKVTLSQMQTLKNVLIDFNTRGTFIFSQRELKEMHCPFYKAITLYLKNKGYMDRGFTKLKPIYVEKIVELCKILGEFSKASVEDRKEMTTEEVSEDTPIDLANAEHLNFGNSKYLGQPTVFPQIASKEKQYPIAGPCVDKDMFKLSPFTDKALAEELRKRGFIVNAYKEVKL
jgi:hypothetical protein